MEGKGVADGADLEEIHRPSGASLCSRMHCLRWRAWYRLCCVAPRQLLGQPFAAHQFGVLTSLHCCCACCSGLALVAVAVVAAAAVAAAARVAVVALVVTVAAGACWVARHVVD